MKIWMRGTFGRFLWSRRNNGKKKKHMQRSTCHWITADVCANDTTRTALDDWWRTLRLKFIAVLARRFSFASFRLANVSAFFFVAENCASDEEQRTRNGVHSKRISRERAIENAIGAHSELSESFANCSVYPLRLPASVQFSGSQLEGFIRTRMQSGYRIGDREMLHCAVTNAWRRHFDASNTNRPNQESFPLSIVMPDKLIGIRHRRWRSHLPPAKLIDRRLRSARGEAGEASKSPKRKAWVFDVRGSLFMSGTASSLTPLARWRLARWLVRSDDDRKLPNGTTAKSHKSLHHC